MHPISPHTTLEVIRSGSRTDPDQIDLCESSDVELLIRFVSNRDEGGFAALVLRHGPGVLRVCRHWLGNGQDAEDAFQATFLILVNRAATIRQAESLDPWLRGVARRVAGRAKQRVDRRRRREGADVDVRDVADRRDLDDRELRPILEAELDRLPEKYRRPIELCYWQGLTNEEAADRLHCPAGTLKWRLSRAKEILRGRLGRLGIAMTVLLMWRRPAHASIRLASEPSGDLGPPRFGRKRLGMDAPPADLVRRTVTLAIYTLDHPVALRNALNEAVARRFRLRRRGVMVAFGLPLLLIAATLAYLLLGSVFDRRVAGSPTMPDYPQSEPIRSSCH